MKPNLTIMVLEDCDEDFYTLQDAVRFATLPHCIVRASSGDECLLLLRDESNGQKDLPKLVLLDLHTPGDDGRKVLNEIRRDDRFKTLPVIVLSTSDNPIDLKFCYSNGANAYHVKPVDHKLHLQALQQIFAYWLGSVSLLV